MLCEICQKEERSQSWMAQTAETILETGADPGDYCTCGMETSADDEPEWSGYPLTWGDEG